MLWRTPQKQSLSDNNFIKRWECDFTRQGVRWAGASHFNAGTEEYGCVSPDCFLDVLIYGQHSWNELSPIRTRPRECGPGGLASISRGNRDTYMAE